ncbi:MAG: acetylornithine/succinylornithine family transaminase [Gammaproteobacteria bacterium TMED1]|nr:MAG: acetylornithine/succinylornithine family transaminase [Gammaproteobacteria bacterium TMED1]|tara:strand:+ start:239 stop:1438 length:1200 start_codon:yes stop_codon:yes gene_type:complete
MSELASTPEMLSSATESIMYVVTRPEQVMVRGKGSYLWDAEGNRYLDFIQGWAVNSLGHCPPVLVRAINKQMKELLNGSPALLNDQMIAAADLLVKNSCLDKIWFGNSGAEVNEGAIKLARKYGAEHLNGAYEIITANNSFHGRTLGLMSASGKEAWHKLFEPKVPGFVHVNFNSLNAVVDAVSDRTCAIMMEPIQGEGGVYVASQEFMSGLRRLCDEKGILLILDEVQTGAGRTGQLFGYQNYNVEPDIMTLGKGLGSGFPVAAFLAKDHVCVFEAGDQGGTFGGQPLAMTAAYTVIKHMLDKNIPDRARRRGNFLKKKLRKLAKETGLSNVRGTGLLVAVDLPHDQGAAVVANAFDKGLLINAPKPNALRFMPALTVSNAELDEMLSILKSALLSVS